MVEWGQVFLAAHDSENVVECNYHWLCLYEVQYKGGSELYSEENIDIDFIYMNS